MTFAASSFAEAAFSSQGISDVEIAVTGVSLSSALGTASVVAIANPNVNVTGVSASVTLGGSGVSAGGNAEVTVVGQALSTALGNEAVVVDSPNVVVSGFGLSTTLGNPTYFSSTNPQPAGEEISTALGTVTVEGVANINITLTGFGLSTTLNNSGITVTSDANPVLTPLTLMSMDLGDISVQLNGDVDVTGFGMTMALSDATAVYAWTEVDDSVTTTWTDVDDSATMTWLDAA